MSVRQLYNALASQDQQAQTPSSSDDIPAQLELDLRAFGSILIQQAGVLLRLPQIVMATASVLYQRFWFVTSFKHFGVRDIALAALFLSSKLEETPIRIRDLINVFDCLLKFVEYHQTRLALTLARGAAQQHAQSRPKEFRYLPMDYFAKEFYDLKEETVIGEMQILKRLGFDVSVQHPYGALVNYLQVLELANRSDVASKAWGFCNDALLTPLLATHPPGDVAAAAIYYACAMITPAVSLPLKPRPWWELFDVSSEETLVHITETVLDLYDRWALTSPDTDQSAVTIWEQAAARKLPTTKSQVRTSLERQSR
ncbi:uncharacterized protein L969DRAFT_92476 [Mixia osmundae IAM 14324]|uniref:Cyclin-like domain-containing protein n=1 Tax=Mixia osmundae (strain CBS 9802 / IAM 14324 / JCM 22182 / KY 12970) TaxID=764103 RepID=G7DXF4_MIXOS|nr:uncharacterized protein L969DRAFT_92476 [Mixia osmundae IAM 14324]KEI41242.1 hypothetical protein L969DRAFT_92476 [Mixia osmundae IAM 14324]GAA95264.1 hypothetical protein E5Q_01920 [Mixia osmundae IAM 14324]